MTWRTLRARLARPGHESDTGFDLIAQDDPCRKQRIDIGAGFAVGQGLRENLGVHPRRSPFAGECDCVVVRGHSFRGPAINQARRIEQRADKGFVIARRENIHLCESVGAFSPIREWGALQIGADLIERRARGPNALALGYRDGMIEIVGAIKWLQSASAEMAIGPEHG